METFGAIFFAFFTIGILCLISYELKTGKLLNRNFSVGTTRAQHPVRFWLMLSAQVFLLGWCIFMCAYNFLSSNK
jgi:uncharacterized BrkB/YihY/UPF0761 family membrane protein